MLNKTTSYTFQKYGEIFNDFTSNLSRVKNPGGRKIVKVSNKSIKELSHCQEDMYIRIDSGIALAVVSHDPDTKPIEMFALHRVTKINAGVYIGFISITPDSRIEIATNASINNQASKKLKEKITYQKIVPTVEIEEILAYYYQVRNANYKFSGEVHDHWELTFIDNGHLNTTIEKKNNALDSYDLVFYAPGQFHTQETDDKNVCSYLTIIFDMRCEQEKKLKNKIFHANREIINIINNLVRTTNDSDVLNPDLMICYLKELIITLINGEESDNTPVANTPMQQKFENEILNEILIYINENIYTAITIEKLCVEFSISRSSLQQLFKNNLNIAPKQYISDLKLNKSKVLIKESKYTISEISIILGFASIHYFSRKFKQRFDITPTDYAKTIYN